MDRFNSLSRRQGSQGAQNVVSGEGGSTELLGEGVGWGELPLVSPQRLQFTPKGPRCPRAHGKSKGILPAVASLAVHVGGERERFTGGQDGGNSSLDPTRCQEMGDEKEEATEKGPFPSSPLCHFFCLGCCIGQGVLSVGPGWFCLCAYTRQSLP